MPDMNGVTFSEDDLGDGIRALTIHDGQTGKRFAILIGSDDDAVKARPLLLEWLAGVRKAA